MNTPPKVPVHGWLILDKPIGLTSTQALGKVRRLLGGKKAGHGGTLDPLATGVLALAFGEATKLIPYVIDGDKEYEFTIKWGEQRSTDDAEGEVIAASPKRPTEAEIRAVLPSFVGQISQIPPAYSAIKLDGERAYDIARSGGIPDLPPRPVIIYALELLAVPDADHAVFRTVCGKGMYVRSLARDIAIALGTHGFVKDLRRTRAGAFTINQSISLENLEALAHKGTAATALLSIRAALGDIPVLQVTASEAQQLRSGRSLLIKPHQLDLMQAPVLMAEHQGTPVALLDIANGAFRVMRGFRF